VLNAPRGVIGGCGGGEELWEKEWWG